MFNLNFLRKVQPNIVIPQFNRAAHMSKSSFTALLATDALYALQTNDKHTYNVLLDEIAYVDDMSAADFAFYCWQRASNAAYSFTPADTSNVQLSLF